MATYPQLESEPFWGAEFAPPNLEAFYKGLRAYLGVGPDAVGGKGDNNHMRGYHRSRRWILLSKFSLYGLSDYSIQGPLDKGGDDNWYSALDATPKSTATLIAMCKRLNAAMRAGELPQVREWYGNIDGDQVVDGWDAVTKKAATSDSSHLWHLHISFFRSRADWDHSNLLAVLTGDDNDMPTLYQVKGRPEVWVPGGLRRRQVPNKATLDYMLKNLGYTLKELTLPAGTDVEKFLTDTFGPVDTELGGGTAVPMTVTLTGNLTGSATPA